MSAQRPRWQSWLLTLRRYVTFFLTMAFVISCCMLLFVSQLQAQGVPMETIQSLAGHAEMDMTEHYLHVQDGVKATAVESLAGLICS